MLDITFIIQCGKMDCDVASCVYHSGGSSSKLFVFLLVSSKQRVLHLKAGLTTQQRGNKAHSLTVHTETVSPLDFVLCLYAKNYISNNLWGGGLSEKYVYTLLFFFFLQTLRQLLCDP